MWLPMGLMHSFKFLMPECALCVQHLGTAWTSHRNNCDENLAQPLHF